MQKVLANFGGGPEPLRGNLKEGMIAELTESTAAAINATALPLSPWAPHATFSLHKVVHDYLQHSGYPGAARAMEAAQLSDGVGGGEAAAGGDHKAQADAVAAHDVEARAEIQAAVLAGDIDRVRSPLPCLRNPEDAACPLRGFCVRSGQIWVCIQAESRGRFSALILVLLSAALPFCLSRLFQGLCQPPAPLVCGDPPFLRKNGRCSTLNLLAKTLPPWQSSVRSSSLPFSDVATRLPSMSMCFARGFFPVVLAPIVFGCEGGW